MDFSKLIIKLEDEDNDNELIIARAGISLILYYDTPVGRIGPQIAAILKDYLSFIAPKIPDKYYTESGTFGKLTSKIIERTINDLLVTRAGDEFFEFNFGSGNQKGSGYGAFFTGTHLKYKSMPKETNELKLEFPPDFLDVKSPKEFIDFVIRISDHCPFQSGTAGYAFQYASKGSHDYDQDEVLAKIVMRYQGFDIGKVDRVDMKGHIHNVSWLNLLGTTLIKKLGDVKQLQKNLPKGASLIPLKHGSLIVTSKVPTVGDIKGPAEALKPLKDFAKVVKPLRISGEDIYLLVDDFAEEWLSRFD